MQNILSNMSEKFHYDRLRNDRALGNRKSDKNLKIKNNVRTYLGPVSGSKRNDCPKWQVCEYWTNEEESTIGI